MENWHLLTVFVQRIFAMSLIYEYYETITVDIAKHYLVNCSDMLSGVSEKNSFNQQQRTSEISYQRSIVHQLQLTRRDLC